MLLAENYIPALKYGAKINLSNLVASGLVTAGNVWWVDGDNGDDTATGGTPASAFKTIQFAVTTASAGDTILIKARNIPAAATDPVSYAETVTVPAGKAGLQIIGLSSDRTQGGLPQLKVGTTSSSIMTIKSPGVLIANLGFNGINGTNSGLQFLDNGTTSVSFGGTVIGCHFKNCRGTGATDSTTGGALWLNGAPWQMNIKGNVFYKNVGGIVISPSFSDPQDIVIEDNVFSGTVSTVDSYIWSNSSANGLVIKGNYFASVLPNLSSGAVKRYVFLTGTTGIFANNYVSGSYTTAGFGASSAAAVIPTTVGIAHNYSDAGLIVRE